MKRCEKCSTENADTLSFCTNCGTPLPINPTAPAPATPEPPREPEPVPPVPPSAPVPPAPMAPAAPVPPVPPAPAKKTDMKSIILIIVAVLGLAVGITGIVMAVTSNNKKEPTSTPSTPTTSQTGGGETVATTTTGTNDGTIVKLGAYNLTIPKDYQYELDDDYLILTDASETWAAGIYYEGTVAYSVVGNNIDYLATALAGEGAQVADHGSATAAGTSYYYINFIDPTDNIPKTYSFFKAGIYTFEVLTTNGIGHDLGILEHIAPILANAKEATGNRDLGVDIGGENAKTLDKDLLLKLEDVEE